jgi:hypothetical protein
MAPKKQQPAPRPLAARQPQGTGRTQSATSNTPRRPLAGPPTPDQWQSLLDSVSTGIGGEFFFVKSPKTTMRLLCFQDNPLEFYAPVESYFRGKQKTKFIIFGHIISTEGQGAKPLSDDWKTKVAPIVITKTALKAILTLLAEGYELFDPEEGHAIKIIKSGSGTDTDYTATPSRDPYPVDVSSLEMPEGDLFEMAQKLTDKNAARNQGSDDGDFSGEEAPF